MNDKDYAILGLHGADVTTVDKVTAVQVPVLDDEGKQVFEADGVTPVTQQTHEIEQRNVARVRMFVGDKIIDEDFDLPRLITIEEQIDMAVEARIAEIKANGVEAESEIVPEQTEQIVEDNPNV